MTELQQQRLQVCENNWVLKIAKSNEDRQDKNGGDRSAAELREEGRMRRGRPMLRWEDCVRRDERKAVEKEVGRRRKGTAGGNDYQMIRWRSCGQDLKHLDKGKRGRDRICYVCSILRFGCQLDVRRFLG